MAYTLQEAANITRAISEYVENNPELLREEGVFRISGATSHVNQIIESTKKGGPLPTNKDYLIHDYISAFKKVIQNSELIEYYTESLTNLIEISPAATQEEKRKSAESLDTFIKTLITYQNPKAAEIIHNCLRLAFLTTLHKENKMDVSNVATILGGTLGRHLFPNEDMGKQTSKAVNICRNALEMTATLGTYNRPYSKSYAQERRPILKEILDFEKIQYDRLRKDQAKTNLTLSSQKADLPKVSIFSKPAIMRAIKGNKQIANTLETLIQEKERLIQKKKDEITLLEKQVEELTPSTPTLERSPAFLVRGMQSLGTKSLEQTPSSSPTPRRPKA